MKTVLIIIILWILLSQGCAGTGTLGEDSPRPNGANNSQSQSSDMSSSSETTINVSGDNNNVNVNTQTGPQPGMPMSNESQREECRRAVEELPEEEECPRLLELGCNSDDLIGVENGEESLAECLAA